MHTDLQTTKDILMGRYQIFSGHDNLRYLNIARKALGHRKKHMRVFEIEGRSHLFTNQTMYQFEEGRCLKLSLFNYKFLQNFYPYIKSEFKWAYVDTPLALDLITQKAVVAVFENGFNLFGFNLDHIDQDPDEGFLSNPMIQHYVRSL